MILVFEDRNQELGQAVVTGLVEMKIVLVPDPGGGLAVGAEQNGGEIDKGEQGVLFAEGPDLTVELLVGFPFAHPLGGWLAGEVDEGSIGKNLADACYEGGEIGECFLDGFPVPEIVLSAVQDDSDGLVTGKEIVEMVKDLGELGPSESAVEHGDSRKVFGQRIPATDGGTTGEEGEVFRGRRIVFVQLSEFLEVLDEAPGIGFGRCLKGCPQEDREEPRDDFSFDGKKIKK